ncbi:GAF domain-containing protein [Actinosynnema sp. NPDC050436]|uniref:GAF domain-containing protein n=1 Tax=Actinosynnema sp. NPDC050436 TaxID=3155659 RepID=UPI0034025F0E
MSASDPARPSAGRDNSALRLRHAAGKRDRITAQLHQHLIDAEVHATRRALLRWARRRGGNDVAVLFDREFLALADPSSLTRAVLTAALTVADSCDLQLLDRDVLRIKAQHGFSPAFLGFFATVDASASTACGRALATGAPVVVDDVTRNPLFAGQAALQVLRDAGSRAVASYPLRGADGVVQGVLSLHHRHLRPSHDLSVSVVTRGVASALTYLSGRAGQRRTAT